MKEFKLLIRNQEDSGVSHSISKNPEFLKACESYIKELQREGHLLSAQPLAEEGLMLSHVGGQWKETAFKEGKEVIVGYYHILANDLQEATSVAKRNPEFSFKETARIEVRPIKHAEKATGFTYPSPQSTLNSFTESDVDPQLDLVFERTTNLSPQQLWEGWTRPETLMKWFCPKPWRVTECRIDLQPSGEFFTLMEGPKGEKMPNHGCYLEVVPNQKLVWTNLMSKGFRPNPQTEMGFSFVATILFQPTQTGCLYRAVVRHADAEAKRKHEQLGFQEGWGMAFEQLKVLFE